MWECKEKATAAFAMVVGEPSLQIDI